MKKLYLAYGSNLNYKQMKYRCPDASVVDTAFLKDYELVFRHGVATVEPREGASVPVLLWSISPRDERALDVYEGFPQLYKKQALTPELEGKPQSVMAYVMTPGHHPALPPEGYLKIIQEGYEDCGFDSSVLEQALARTQELIQQEQQIGSQQFQV